MTSLDQVVEVADRLTGLLGIYYGLIFVILGLGAWVLMRESRLPRAAGGAAGWATLGAMLLISLPIIRVLRKLQSDSLTLSTNRGPASPTRPP